MPRPTSSPDLRSLVGATNDASPEWQRAIRPWLERVEHEVVVLRSLLEVHERTRAYDLMGMSTAVFTAHSRLSTVGRQLVSESGGGSGGGGKRLISEWWTQMDGFWGGNTTRALQQYLNSQRSADQPEFEMLACDATFGPLTIQALQLLLNRAGGSGNSSSGSDAAAHEQSRPALVGGRNE
mmetsp:Transcript_52253/g.123715  ORF Transcript_52253/g.123715 Transcript_52253/m.123715 type:complete len:181 (+) Transcript_52253:357-899(+)